MIAFLYLCWSINIVQSLNENEMFLPSSEYESLNADARYRAKEVWGGQMWRESSYICSKSAFLLFILL